ncbi:MAG: hypothetical protein JSW27_09850 [Phycisphaerales bacterium]|nr:MAG: hypothetical protein JSW27_09850 [Phycisphaerales bacterium]
MRRFAWPVLGVLLASTALASVSVHVYRADEQTPLEPVDPNNPEVYRDIMVGTRLTLFVVSDSAESKWAGGLWISWDDSDTGILSGRDFNDLTLVFEGSVLPTAGRDPHIFDSPDASGMQFALDVDNAMIGEWFVLDYHAKVPGTCDVGLFAYGGYDGYDPSNGEPPPAGTAWIQNLTFNHVPSQDHNGDSKVDFQDFALWATRWQEISVPDPNAADPNDSNAPDPNDPNVPAATDPNEPHVVDARELALFCTYWLERTDVNEVVSDPNVPEAP